MNRKKKEKKEGLNGGIRFCEDCRFRVRTADGVFKCGHSMKSLRFYDRTCEQFSPVEEGKEFVWDNYLKVYVLS